MARILRRAVALVVLLVALALLVGLDFVADVSSSWRFLVGWAGAFGAAGLSILLRDTRVFRAAVVGSFLAACLAVRWVDWNSRKPFLRDLDSLRAGMSRADAERIMGRWMRGTGWPSNPMTGGKPGEAFQVPDSDVWRHTNEGWGDSDWGVVTYDAGFIASVEFLPD